MARDLAKHMARDLATHNHFRAWSRLMQNGKGYKLYAWNVSQRQYQYLKWELRHYVHKTVRDNTM